MRLSVCLSAFCCLPLLATAAPLAPSNLTATATNYSTVALTWNDNSNNEAGFLIGQRIPPAAGFSSLGTIGPGTTSVDIINRTGNTTYDFVVVAYDAANAQSPFSNIATVTTPIGVTSSNFRAAYLQKPFSFNLTSSNPATVTGYAITALPQGLTLTPATGLISGTPTTAGKTTGQVTITHTGGATATAALTIRVFVDPPALLPPVVSGTPPANQSLALGAPAGAPLSLTGLFTDPDVSSAARLTTDQGNLDFAFYPGSAPQTVANFLGYLNRGDFLNTIFHRSIPGFIIQAGAFRADATASTVPTQPPVVNEPNITNLRGTIAMAKLGGNPDSATNQFFVNLADNSSNLDNQNEGFTVFGRVAGNGLTVAEAIAALPTKDYSTINSALTDAPVRNNPPSYDPASLVRLNTTVLLAPLALSATSSLPAVVTPSVSGSDLTLAPLSRGTATITLTATDLDSQTVTSSFEVTVKDAYDLWAAAYAFGSPAAAEASADPDKDELINLTEFALASSPIQAGTNSMLHGLDQGHLFLRFFMRFPLTGTTVTLQSAALPAGPWTDRWSSTEGFTHPWITTGTTTDDGITVTAKDPAPLNPGNRYLRLKITRP
jgi:cyclophilin family peptidyl-prolyl cis-trans isomerase